MKIFIASSTENLDLVREVEIWIQDQKHDPYPWDKPGLLPPGHQTFLALIDISKKMDAAIFIFGSEDKVWYRGDTTTQPRDNVLIEYGLFAGQVGPARAIICTHGNPKTAADLLGIKTINLAENKRALGRVEINHWARQLKSKPVEGEHLKLVGRVHQLEEKVDALSQRVTFEEDKSADLERMLKDKNVVDFKDVVLNDDGHWKLLYNFEYFEGTARLLADSVPTPVELRRFFEETGSGEIADKLSWQAPGDMARTGLDYNPQRNISLSRKALRVFRQYSEPKKYQAFVANIKPVLHARLTELANTVLSPRAAR